MQDSHARLIEGLPPRSQPDRTRPANARAVRELVEQLPLANPSKAARDISELLEQMLATRWPGGDRVDALEAIRVPVSGLCEGIEQQLGVESHPMPPAKERLVETASGFHRALAQNYALALHELGGNDGKLSMFKGKAAATAAVRALHHLGIALQWCYRLYRTPPTGVWRRAHALHAFAEDVGVVDKSIADPLPDGAEIDANQAYTHALLLALSNPYRFSPKELREAWLLTRAFAPHCALLRHGGAGIAVDEDSDEGPGYVPEERVAANGAILSLDLSALKRFLQEHAALQPTATGHLTIRQRGAPSIDASIAFLHRLRSSWTGAAERGFVRVQAGHSLDAVIGLNALHYVLAGHEDFGVFMQGLHGGAITLSSQEHAAAWASGADGTQPHALNGQVLDQSLGGYRLRLHANGSLRVRVGEVIGLAPPVEPGELQEWMAGLIRWLRAGDDGIYVGVELLARRARAAGVRLVVGADDELHAPQRAVLIPDRDAAAMPSLLVAHMFDMLASEVEVTMPADPSDWASRAGVRRYSVAAVEELSTTYYRVILAGAVDAQAAVAPETPGSDDGES